MKELWIRIGAAIRITDAEVQDIFSDDEVKTRDTLQRVTAEGRFCPDGETYVPNESVREFNRAYGTAYEEDDWFCDL